MWTDTHLHLDDSAFDPDRPEVLARAQNAYVTRFVIPAVYPNNFKAVRDLAHRTPGAFYCLGIHPCFVDQCGPDALSRLKDALVAHHDDPKLVAVGEIGLDGFISNLNLPKQTEFYEAQLKLAKEFDLPVVMHVRKAQDQVLKGLRRFKPVSGIAHAFNGSLQQADQFIALNMCLGFGGACTYTRAKQLRRLAATLPKQALVLETDSPDMGPAWQPKGRNEPAHLARIGQTIAQLRSMAPETLAPCTTANANRVLPRLMPSSR